jgi:hypothetical protein
MVTKKLCNGRTHPRLQDMSQGLGKYRHYICLDCGYHKYKGKKYTKAEWEAWIESTSN